MTTETKNETDAQDPQIYLNFDIMEITMDERDAWKSFERSLSTIRSMSERSRTMLHKQMDDALCKYRSQVDLLSKTLQEEIARLTADLESVQKVAHDATERNKELSEQNSALLIQKENLSRSFNLLRMEYEESQAAACAAESSLPSTSGRGPKIHRIYVGKPDINKVIKEKNNEIKRLEEKLQEAQRKPAALAKGVVDYAVERLSDIRATPDPQGYMAERTLIDLLIKEVFCKHLTQDDINPLLSAICGIAAARSKAKVGKPEEHTPVQHNDHCQQFFAPVDKSTFNNNKNPDK